TESELVKLLEVARQRPLLEAMTVRRGKRKGQAGANLSAATRKRLEQLGLERALIYKMLVLTGLRKDELATLTVGPLELDGPAPHAQLEAANEKNREGNAIALRADLVTDLKHWLSICQLSHDSPVFRVPDKLIKILNRDLQAAGIPKRDKRGYTLDVH